MTVKLNHAEIAKLSGPFGPAALYLRNLARATLSIARSTAPRSQDGSHNRPSGYMAEHIEMEEGEDHKGFYTEVISPARTPTGFPYGGMVERQHPYLVPALRAATSGLRQSGLVDRARVTKRRRRKAN